MTTLTGTAPTDRSLDFADLPSRLADAFSNANLALEDQLYARGLRPVDFPTKVRRVTVTVEVDVP